MSAISLKSITGITSITTPAGVDNQLTLHNNNTTEAVKLDIAGNLHFHNHLNITGVSTASNFKTGTSNLHNTGLNVQDLDVNGTSQFQDDVTFQTQNGNNIVVDKSDNSLKVGDNIIAKFGDNSGNGDLWIYHDTGHSYVRRYGSGNLRLTTSSGLSLIHI